MEEKNIHILGIESSCDDTAAAILSNGNILANIVAGQEIHRQYGGVVPELASRAHLQSIIPVVDSALKQSGISLNQLSAIAFTRGPGLPGSLSVGVAFAKSLSLSLGIPMLEVNHMNAHILSHFIKNENDNYPAFPFLCLTVSGGHTQIVVIRNYLAMEVIGQTTDDAAGEAFDKAAKVLGLPYPGGPLIDKYSKGGNPAAYKFPVPNIPAFDFSFSGLKTSFLYFIRDHSKADPHFVENNLADICASYQAAIVHVLMLKLKAAAQETGITNIAIAGGVSANSRLRNMLAEQSKISGWNLFTPPFEYCTDNAAMIAIAGYYKYLAGEFADQSVAPDPRMKI